MRRSALLVAACAAALLAPATAASAAPQPTPPPRGFAAVCPPDLVPDSGFADVPGVYADAVDCLAWYGVTVGTGDGEFDAAGGVSRGQMALFLERVYRLSIPAPGERGAGDFSDVGSGVTPEQRSAIDGMYSVGVLQGGADNRYRPFEPVRRDQMASFLNRLVASTWDYSATEVSSTRGFGPVLDCFADVTDENIHADAVRTACGAGVAVGDGTGTYYPTWGVTRGQMALFLARTMDYKFSEQDNWSDSGNARATFPEGAPRRPEGPASP